MGKTGPFHPDLKIARFLPRAIVSRRSFPIVRFAFRTLARFVPRTSEIIRLANGQTLLLHRPATPAKVPTPALLWVHGGGLVIGHPAHEEAFCARIAEALGIVVAAPSYRLAPEHPYPAALDDLDAALAWLAAAPGIDPARIALGGDSAGGGLAACLAIRASQRDGPKPCFQLLHEPMLDEATRNRPDPDPAGLRMWNGQANRFGWNAYLAGVGAPVPATASAACARNADLARLPPAWIGVGTADLFHDEAARYAERLAAAGVDAVFHPVPGGFHGFDRFAPKAAVSRAYSAEMDRALAHGLGLSRREA